MISPLISPFWPIDEVLTSTGHTAVIEVSSILSMPAMLSVCHALHSTELEKAHSASTDVGGIDSKREYTSCKLRLHTALLSNTAVSLFM